MSTEATSDSSSTQPDEQMIGDNTNTLALLEACVLNADHDALQEHLKNSKTEQSILDRCLMLGLEIVQREEQEMERVAPALQLLGQFGAKWNPDSLLAFAMTPYHLICLSAGDHHELLDLLLQSSEQTLLHAKDCQNYTALMYAVKNANINCLRSLITHGAEVNTKNSKEQPLCLAIEGSQDHSKHSPIIMTEIFDLLLDSGADVDKAMLSVLCCGRIECMKKLIMIGANLYDQDGCVWRLSAQYGRVDLLKCLLDRGIDKDITDEDGTSLLWYVTHGGNVDAIRYLLDQGVKIPTDMNVSEACHELCKHCGMNMLVLDDYEQHTQDPCTEAVRKDMLEVVQLFEKYGSKNLKYYSVFRLAVICGSVKVIEYLHRKYRHPLNINYNISDRRSDCKHWTLLTEACSCESIKGVEYLLEHGACLNKGNKVDRCSSALIVAIQSAHVEIIALLIYNGVDINFRSYDYENRYVLPFEAAVLHDCEYRLAGDICTVEMLLVSGCSYGVYGLAEDHQFKAKNNHDETKNLMMKWNVQENNVKPLLQQCRRMILKRLSPRASKMIEKLPLPPGLIKYLRIPELDDIVARYKRRPTTCIPVPIFYTNNALPYSN